MKSPAFVIGSPRSGTTFLGDVLDLHDYVTLWYEPYFVYDRGFKNAPNDHRAATDATSPIRKHILHELQHFSRRHPKNLIVDKSPRNSLKVPFLLRIFPDAKFVHIVRDGRDTILSIQAEWNRRSAIIDHGGSAVRAVKTLARHVNRQLLLRHKLQVLGFEFGQPQHAFKGRSYVVHTTRRWNGRIGWGPKFEGWENIIDDIPQLHFNALQWKHCLEGILAAKSEFSKENFLEIRYEDLVRQPLDVLHEIFTFLQQDIPGNFDKRMPPVKSTNFNKWEHGFSLAEKQLIGPIINPLLIQLGYAEDDQWYA